MRKEFAFAAAAALLLLGNARHGYGVCVDDVVVSGSAGGDGVVNYRAVICGVSNYQDPRIRDLNYCDDDAQGFRSALLASSNWSSSNIALRVDSAATKGAVRTAIQNMADASDADDVCVFFFSGHGTNGGDLSPYDEADGLDEYICPYDSIKGNVSTMIRDDELSTWIGAIPTRKIVSIFDACYSGGQIKGIAGATLEAVVKTINQDGPVSQPGDGFADDLVRTGAKDLDDLRYGVVLAACNDDEQSAELGGLQHGVFTYCLLQGLDGRATDSDADGWISAEELYDYDLDTSCTVGWNEEQHPQIYDGHSGELNFLFLGWKCSCDVGQSIVDWGTVISTLTVSDTGTLADVDVRVRVNHSCCDQLDVYLQHPDGTLVELFTDVGGSGAHFIDTVLDDEAAIPVTSGSAPFTGSYRPEGLLSALDGRAAAGTWKLRVHDDSFGHYGTLQSWCLRLTTGCTPPNPPTSASASPATICVGGSSTLTATGGSGEDLQWSTSCHGAVIGPGNGVSVSPTSTTTYYAWWHNGCGDSDCASVEVAVNPQPVAPTAASNSPLCEGATLKLTASMISGASYRWTGPNGFTSSDQNPSIANATTAVSGLYSITATVGNCTSPAGSTMVTVSGPCQTIPAVKKLADGEGASLFAKAVTHVSTDLFYIEEDSRICGIRVEKAGHGLSVGTRADVTGTVQTDTQTMERYVAASVARENGSGTVAPVFTNNKSVGGGEWFYDSVTGAGQKGVSGACGLNNIGLLVRISGRTVQPIDTTSFHLDDGSGASLRVAAGGLVVPGEGDYVTVTGISSCYQPGAEPLPLVLATAVRTVCAPPRTTTQPQSQTKSAGQSAAFSVTASGSELASGTRIAGADTASLSINPVVSDDAGDYDCIVSNACGSATSSLGMLTVAHGYSGEMDRSALPYRHARRWPWGDTWVAEKCNWCGDSL